MQTQTIPRLLKSILDLLIESGDDEWAEKFGRFIVEYETSPRDTMDAIRRIYGGMGSFSDLVLHKDSRMLLEENDRLESLRSELYKAC